MESPPQTAILENTQGIWGERAEVIQSSQKKNTNCRETDSQHGRKEHQCQERGTKGRGGREANGNNQHHQKKGAFKDQ